MIRVIMVLSLAACVFLPVFGPLVYTTILTDGLRYRRFVESKQNPKDQLIFVAVFGVLFLLQILLFIHLYGR